MKPFFFLLCLVAYGTLRAQELYPTSEPASTMGKNVLGLRGIWETYNESGAQRHQLSLRMIYGVTPNLTIYLQPNFNNHHGDYLPADFTSHTHFGGQIFTYAPNKVFGRQYPFAWGGLLAYAKYRFFSLDGQHRHFRLAGYGSYSTANAPHDEAEPNLTGDTGGFGAGLIATALEKRFAATFTAGMVWPGAYSETQYFDTLGSLSTQINYGTAYTYGLALGYLIHPQTYRDYQQTNYNLYLELNGKKYQQAGVFQNGEPVAIESFTLYGGNYIDATFSIQAIFNSNTRLDFSVEVPLVNRSWSHFYPLYQIAVQHSIFPGRK
jgi:hypothetical protein